MLSYRSAVPGISAVPDSFWGFPPRNASEVMYGILEVWYLYGMPFVNFCMSRHLMFGVVLEGSRTYACLILSPVSLHTCLVVGQTKYQATVV